ncbi:MAG: ABC transporter permease [Elusimicrobia bacterium]|nr:ABC transporter permease [Elusimicrobiota bacterium]
MRSWFILFSLELKKFRQGWIWSFVMASLFPLCLLFFMRMSSGQASREAALYTISGIIVFSLVLNTTIMLANELSQIKEAGALDFYATLPVSRLSVLLAILCRSVVFSLPATVSLLAVGAFVYGFPILSRLPLLGAAVLLAALPLSGLGGALGLALPHPRHVSLAAQVFYLIVVFLSPVMIPEEALPAPLVITSSLLPTTYVARCLRAILQGSDLTAQFFSDAAVVLLFSLCSGYYLAKKLDWRQK